MPTITESFRPVGPTLHLLIGASLPRAAKNRELGKPVIGPVQGEFLIDTGAACTCVDIGLLVRLGIEPTGDEPIHTPSTGVEGHMVLVFDISLTVPATKLTQLPLVIEALPVFATAFRENNQEIDGVIGRDVLSQCVFILDGPSKLFILSY
jgi:hypothetical protein